MAVFYLMYKIYFLDAMNRAANQPTMEYPNSHDRPRISTNSCFFLSFAAPRYDGAKNTHITNKPAIIYLTTNNTLTPNNILFYTIFSVCSQFFFDTNQLVVFRHTIRSGHRTSFDLTCVCCHS